MFSFSTKNLKELQERLALKIAPPYYRKREEGAGEYCFLLPRFWKSIVRFGLTDFLLFMKGNKGLRKKYAACIGQTFFPLQHIHRPKQFFVPRFKEFFFTLVGLRHYCPEVYRTGLDRDLSQLAFDNSDKPKVSIIITVYNQLEYTLNCLQSIKDQFSNAFPIEIIVIDDCSSDDTPKVLSVLTGIKYIRNEQNLGFLLNCKKAARVAKGEHLCFLSNETLVLPNWLEQLVATIEREPGIGMVGSKLLFPYGLLQEAGSMVFEDGSLINYGKGDVPTRSKYNFRRETDYCSGCSVLVSKNNFALLGGGDEEYVPSCYGAADLCMAIRNRLNKKVIYEPTSVLIHFEGVSCGKTVTEANVRASVKANRLTFMEKWKKELNRSHKKVGDEYAARKYLKRPCILIMDRTLPEFDKDSGSLRMYSLIKIFLEKNFHVIYFSANSPVIEPYHAILTSLAVEIIYPPVTGEEVSDELLRTLPFVDIVWASRPEINHKYIHLKKKIPHIKWLYDTVDLHYVRLEKECQITGGSEALRSEIIRYKELEYRLAQEADITITITPEEKAIMSGGGIASLEVVPNIHAPESEVDERSFNARKDLLFIGGYHHKPNIDTALWLCHDIMPLIWDAQPSIKLYLVGSHPSPAVLALASDRVIVTGYISNVAPYFNQARVFIAPLRYGAGMKGKIGQSLAFALPIVTSIVGSEGMNLNDGEDVLIAETAAEFAAQTLRLYHDKTLWEHLHRNAQRAIADKSPERVMESLNWMDKLCT